MSAIWDEIKHIKNTARDLRNFGYVVGAVCLALAVWFYFSGRHASQPVAAIGLALVLAGFLFPRVLTPFYKPWMALGVVLGFVMTRVILLVAFFVIITPLALVMRLLGKRFLETEFKSGNGPKTYWHYREAGVSSKKQLEKQF